MRKTRSGGVLETPSSFEALCLAQRHRALLFGLGWIMNSACGSVIFAIVLLSGLCEVDGFDEY